MTDNDRNALVSHLEGAAARSKGDRTMLLVAAQRIRADGLRLKAQTRIAITVNDTLEAILQARRRR